MLIRAIGPGLKNFGLTGVLEQPRIRLVDQTKPADTSLVDQNTHWLEAGNRNELRAVFAGLGAFFLQDDASDATVYLPIQPGPYTAVVEGVDGDIGPLPQFNFDDLGLVDLDPGLHGAQVGDDQQHRARIVQRAHDAD